MKSLTGLKTESLPKVSKKLGDVVELPLGGQMPHVPTLIGSSIIAFQQGAINLPIHVMQVKNPGDPVLAMADKIGRGVGSKWETLPGSVYPIAALWGHSSISGTPAGTFHLIKDLREVVRDIIVKAVDAGGDPKAVIKQLLTAADLNFAAVQPASKGTVGIAKKFPVGLVGEVPNLLLPLVFDDRGLKVILSIRNEAIHRGIGDGMEELQLGPPRPIDLEKAWSEAHKASAP